VSTDTLKGLALKSTQAKTDAGTDDDVYVTAKQLQDITATIPGLTPGNPAVFRGALVNNSVGQTLATSDTLEFDSEIYDTDSIHDTVTNNTRLTVPSGVTRVKLKGQCGVSATITGSITMSMTKNGATPDVGVTQKIDYSASSPVVQVFSPVFDVTASDYFELNISGATGSPSTSTTNTWFAMEIIE
jgi:hypothetical protein